MPAYVLPREHGPALKSGRQRLLVAAPRTDQGAVGGSPHAIVADPVMFDLAAKAPHKRERVREGVCIFRAGVVITPTGLLRVINPRWREHDQHAPQAERLARCLANAEQGSPRADAKALKALAALAGFRSWRSLYEYHADPHRAPRAGEGGEIAREIIGWAV